MSRGVEKLTAPQKKYMIFCKAKGTEFPCPLTKSNMNLDKCAAECAGLLCRHAHQMTFYRFFEVC